MRNNEEIIRIASELQSDIRRGLVALIENEAPPDALFPLLDAISRLDRIASELVEKPLSGDVIASELQ